MSLLGKLMDELKRPDDQGNDWYGWATNQMSHTLLGVVTALHFPNAALQMAAIFALLKETADMFRGSKLSDSLVDVSFWMFGAMLITLNDKISATILIVFALVCGVIPRLRKTKLQ